EQGIDITPQDLPVSPTYVQGVKDAGGEVFYTSKWFNAALIQADQGIVADIENLSFVDSVQFIAPDAKPDGGSGGRIKTHETPPSNIKQLDLLGIKTFHKQGFFGENILMAFFDGGFTGVDQASPFSHLFTNGRIKHTLNLVEKSESVYKDSNHGTRVFSTVSALDSSYTGVSPLADFMLFITEDVSSEYRIEEYNWLIAAEKADSAGVDIISSSVGYNIFDDPSMNYSQDDLDGMTAVITRAADIAFAKGMLVFTSAGNEGDDAWQKVTVPADAFNIIAVGAVTNEGELSAFSSTGPTADGRIKPEVVAQGSSTWVVNHNDITISSGTSFAAPQIAGLAALLWQQNSTFTNNDIRSLILSMGSNAETPDNNIGYGIPNYNLTLAIEPQKEPLKVFPNPVSDQLKVVINTHGPVQIEVYDHLGRKVLVRNYEKTTNQITLDLQHLPEGNYLLKVIDRDRYFSQRFIKW
ncbi:MAG: S8/S53 family peptidase, partial [Fulvivirga sp.]|nr:S8/S53 family peptidase [Fulvivirga sp.]